MFEKQKGFLENKKEYNGIALFCYVVYRKTQKIMLYYF